MGTITLHQNEKYFEDTPLHLATLKGNCEIIQLLLDHNADINASDHHGFTPLQHAIEDNQIKVTKLLLERGANPNLSSSGYHLPLHLAVKSGYLEIVELLISYNVDLNHKGWSGGSALHWLAFTTSDQIILSQRNVEMFNVLLKSGACINSQNKHGNNLIEICLDFKNIGLAKVIWFN